MNINGTVPNFFKRENKGGCVKMILLVIGLFVCAGVVWAGEDYPLNDSLRQQVEYLKQTGPGLEEDAKGCPSDKVVDSCYGVREVVNYFNGIHPSVQEICRVEAEMRESWEKTGMVDRNKLSKFIDLINSLRTSLFTMPTEKSYASPFGGSLPTSIFPGQSQVKELKEDAAQELSDRTMDYFQKIRSFARDAAAELPGWIDKL